MQSLQSQSCLFGFKQKTKIAESSGRIHPYPACLDTIKCDSDGQMEKFVAQSKSVTCKINGNRMHRKTEEKRGEESGVCREDKFLWFSKHKIFPCNKREKQLLP